MKTLWILGFVITLGFLAPLAQAAPPDQPDVTHAAQPAAPPADQHDHDRGPLPPPTAHTHPGPWTDAGRDRNGNPPAPESAPAPDAASDQEAAAAISDDTDSGALATSCDASATAAAPAHYTMDDLANAGASLDAPYDSTHFSMDDIGGL
jgi:hypothetical protein